MSILIKGMELPKSCFECRFMYARCFCAANSKIQFDDDEYSELKGRYKGCPLIPVPPHGRLIDADKLFAKIPEGDIEHDVKISRTGAIADVCTWVLTAPTIIEAEE